MCTRSTHCERWELDREYRNRGNESNSLKLHTKFRRNVGHPVLLHVTLSADAEVGGVGDADLGDDRLPELGDTGVDGLRCVCDVCVCVYSEKETESR